LSPVAYSGVGQAVIRHSRHIFPNLQDVDLGTSEKWLIAAFLLPGLQSLTISNQDDVAASIIIQAVRTCPNLRNVRVAFISNPWRNSYAVIENTFAGVAKNAEQIESLEFLSYTPQVVVDNIAFFARLQRLEIGVGHFADLPLPPSDGVDSPTSVHLPFLRTLIIRGFSIKNLPALTRYLTCPLEVVDVRSTETSGTVPGGIGIWLRVLREVHLTTLKSLRITILNIIDSYSRPVDGDLVTSLAGLQLKELYLEGFSFNDKVLGELPAVSRSLEVLTLMDLVRDPGIAPTFSGLLNILRGCPVLKSLTINFDEGHPPAIDGGSRLFNLRVLDIDRSRIGCPVEIAEALAKALPKLEKIYFWKDHMGSPESRKVFRDHLQASQRRWRLAESRGEL
jgi:hypothetical protein